MNKEIKISRRIKTIISYILTGIICLIYANFIDMKFGMTFFAFLIFTPGTSYFLTKITLKKVEITVDVSAALLNKGDKAELTVHIKSRHILPTPFINIKLAEPLNLSCDGYSEYYLSVNRKKDEIIKTYFTANIRGEAEIGVACVTASDFLGLYSFPLFKNSYFLLKKIDILPNIPIVNENSLLKNLIETIEPSDDEESESNAFFGNAIPGYEHREYVPGDSLKRINWKLSAKQEKYMVRMDEIVGNKKQILILDPINRAYTSLKNEELLEQLYLDERIIEALLATLYQMVKKQMDSTLYMFADGKWQTYDCEKNEDITALQYLLSKYSFRSASDLQGVFNFPSLKQAAFTMFTSNKEAVINQNNIITVCPYNKKISNESYFVDENFSFIKL